jgi:hypothetical protein
VCEAVPGLRPMLALADVKSTPQQSLTCVELSIYRIAEGKEIGETIDTAKASGASVLNVLTSPIFFGNRKLVIGRGVRCRTFRPSR